MKRTEFLRAIDSTFEPSPSSPTSSALSSDGSPSNRDNHLVKELADSEFKNRGNVLVFLRDLILRAIYETDFFSPSGEKQSYPYPYIVICQRSGTGKTRLMLELAKQFFVSVYISLSGFTSSPKCVRDYLISLKSGHARTNAILKAKKLILSIIDYALKQKKNGISNENIVLPFMPGEQPDKNRIWNEIVDMAEKNGDALIDDWENMKGTKELVLISIDEAGQLLQCENDDVSPFRNLRAALKELQNKEVWKKKKRPFFVLFADTSARVTEFAPAQDSSLRVNPEAPAHLYPPFFEIDTKDILADDYLTLARKAFADACKNKPHWDTFLSLREADEAMNQFLFLGSPIWRASFKAIGDLPSRKEKIDRLVQFANEKLALSKQNIAFVASRTSLVLNPESKLAVDLVAKSMAHLQLLSHDRQKVDIVYPSEPTLAAGATHYLKLSGHTALQEVHQMLLNKQVSIGDLGEFAAEILALSAIDGVLTEPYLKSITVEQFVRSLVTPEAFKEILKLNPSNLPIWNGKVFFNHFIRLDDDLSPSLLAMLFARGAAGLGVENQAASDMFIPVVLKNSELTCLCLQIKNRKKRITPANVEKIFTVLKTTEDLWLGQEKGQVNGSMHVLLNFRRGLDFKPTMKCSIVGKTLRTEIQGFSEKLFRVHWGTARKSFSLLREILAFSLDAPTRAKTELTKSLFKVAEAQGHWDHSYGSWFTSDETESSSKPGIEASTSQSRRKKPVHPVPEQEGSAGKKRKISSKK